jgi:hypothetical protein
MLRPEGSFAVEELYVLKIFVKVRMFTGILRSFFKLVHSFFLQFMVVGTVLQMAVLFCKTAVQW